MTTHIPTTEVDPVRTWLLTQARAWRVAHAPDMPAVTAWCNRFVAVTGPVPALGTPGWVVLPDTDPRKVAAAVGPAVARLTENIPAAITQRLRQELAAIDHAVVERIRAASWDLSGAQDWRHAAHCPSHAELVRRRSLATCFHCKTTYAWTADRCPACDRDDSAPDQIRAEATRSWTHPSTPDRSAA